MEPLYQRALRIYEAAREPNPPDVARVLNNLAILYSDQGQYERAKPLHQRALRIRLATLGPNHPDVVNSLNDLAILYRSQGLYEHAQLLFQRTLRARLTALSFNHPDVANSLNDLAILYRSQGLYEHAEPLFQSALRIRQASLGHDHPYVANSLHDLALLYCLQDKLPQSLQHAHRASELFEQRLRNEGLVLSDGRFDVLLASLRKQEEDIYSIVLPSLNQTAPAHLALAVALLRKGRAADEAAQFSQTVYRGLSQADRQQFERLRALRSRFSTLSLSGPGPIDPASYHNQLATWILRLMLSKRTWLVVPLSCTYATICRRFTRSSSKSQRSFPSIPSLLSWLPSICATSVFQKPTA